MYIKNLVLALTILLSYSLQAQETYTVGTTEYYSYQTYSTTGKPKVKRSEANKTAFLKEQGYSETPYGYQIDHIIPLSQGGTDDPSNMQLLTVDQHKAKTARERRNSSSSSLYSPTYTRTTTSSYLNTIPSTSTGNTSDRTYYTGSRGGTYYINSSGNKVYSKPKSSSTSTYSIPSSPSSSYYSAPSSPSRTIQTGSRGGKYYINSNGNKTYVKKNN